MGKYTEIFEAYVCSILSDITNFGIFCRIFCVFPWLSVFPNCNEMQYLCMCIFMRIHTQKQKYSSRVFSFYIQYSGIMHMLLQQQCIVLMWMGHHSLVRLVGSVRSLLNTQYPFLSERIPVYWEQQCAPLKQQNQLNLSVVFVACIDSHLTQPWPMRQVGVSEKVLSTPYGYCPYCVLFLLPVAWNADAVTGAAGPMTTPWGKG